MPDRSPFRLEIAEIGIQGLSAAGIESCFRIDPPGLAFDLVRCPEFLVPVSTVFLSHSHLDHAAGVAWQAAQRKLQGLEPATVHVPEETVRDWTRLLAIQSELQGGEVRVNLIGDAPGDEHRIGRDFTVRAHPAFHSVPSRSWELRRRRTRLREELRGRPEEEIRALAAGGATVSDEDVESLVFYSGDTDTTIFDEVPEIFAARVAMIECSFVAEEDRERASRYRHIHLSDIAGRAGDFENEAIVLTHFSRRHGREEIMRAIGGLPASLRGRVTAVL